MSFSIRTRTVVRRAAIACASLALLATAAQAQGRSGGRGHGGVYVANPGFHGGYGHGGYYGHRHGYYPRGWGWGWGGVGLGLGLGLGLSSYYYDYPGRDYVIVEPPVVYDSPRPVPQVTYLGPAQPAQPVIYPRNGQDAARIDADSDACSQWAGSQPNATKDASVFRRAIEACMDARGYTLR
jgi:hypothetical protein